LSKNLAIRLYPEQRTILAHRGTQRRTKYIYYYNIKNSDDYLVVAKVRERLAVSKQDAQKFDGERFSLRKLNELEVKKKYQIEIKNRNAALENLNADEDVNRAWENIKENTKTSAKESLCLHGLKQHKP
jgi:hypothetical protein